MSLRDAWPFGRASREHGVHQRNGAKPLSFLAGRCHCPGLRYPCTKSASIDPDACAAARNRSQPLASGYPARSARSSGESVLFETRDAADGQIRNGMTVDDLRGLGGAVAHPLTGPVEIIGARPGDTLEISFEEIVPQPYGWTRIRPGAGFLRDWFHRDFLVHWTMADGFARSEQVPGVRIPEGCFMGTAGVAPSHEQLVQWTRREADWAAQGGFAAPPDARDAVPAHEPVASTGLRTIPPRENGGNADIRQLTRGSRLQLPVAVPGAMFSVGDAHYAQGDSECCITAIEMGATVVVRFNLLEGHASRTGMRWPRFAHDGYFMAPEWAAPRGFVATTGMPVHADGRQSGENLTLAAQNALLEMINLICERGFSREQAYVICSVAVDLRISNAVDLPNVTVSALLPTAIFD
ncbi:MAG: acetamidase/formamidase family protein [Burkholderiaceae bacterium]